MLPAHTRIGSKLLWLAIFIALVMGLVVLVVAIAFNRVENLSADIARHGMSEMVENAAIGRELSMVFSDVDAVSRSCHGSETMEDATRLLSASIEEISRKVKDQALAESAANLSLATTRLFYECTRINKALATLRDIDRQFQDELDKLEMLIGRAMIEQTLAGKTTEHLDQVMTLVMGYRETVLLIARKIAEQSLDHTLRRSQGDTIRAQIEDLALRLQTLTASTPRIAQAGKHLTRLIVDYRGEAKRFDIALRQLDEAMEQSYAAKGSVLDNLNRLDKSASGRVDRISAELQNTVKAAGRQVIWLSVLVALLTLLTVIWIIRRHINQPLRRVIHLIDDIRAGRREIALVNQQKDEWGAISTALLNMSVELGRSQDMLKNIINTVPIRVFWKDREFRYLGCNPTFARDAGKSDPAEIIGMDDFQMPWREQADRFRADDREVMESGVGKLFYEECMTTHDGRNVWQNTSKIPLKNSADETVGVLGIYEDITQRKQDEAELRKYQEHLEDLVQERTTALSIAKEMAEAASRSKSLFLANMSHEVRTPMNGILGMIELVIRRIEDPVQKKQLQKAQVSAQNLLRIINDILDISKIEAERMTLEKMRFKLDDVFDHLTSLIAQKALDKGLDLRMEIPAELGNCGFIGDSLRLEQILLNLVSNAVKFTEKGCVTLHVLMVEETDSERLLRFEVRDTGIGISAEDQKRLFTAFEQADGSMTRKYGGTGLGLAISKRLAQMMGGTMGVESAVGQGSTFWFTVRLDKAVDTVLQETLNATESPESLLRRKFSGTRVLLVEDEPINQEVSRHLLEEVGLQVDLAQDGLQALEMAGQNRYALIMMDIQMPNLNGIDATRAIRLLPKHGDVPILAMTANAYDEDRKACIAAGMNDHISKPVAPEALFKTLLKWMEVQKT